MLEKADQPIEPKEEIKEEETVEPAITLSNEEKDLFARLVEAEAKGESYEGKVAVATVVLNRLESPEFPDTVTNVINEVVGAPMPFHLYKTVKSISLHQMSQNEQWMKH